MNTQIPALRRPARALARHARSPQSVRMSSSSMPRFPGAVNSPHTGKMEWTKPSSTAPIPTYRILNADNVIEDKSQITAKIPSDEILKWYKNMLTVNIMDGIMYDAQRHGRVSFYMVSAGEEAVMVGSAAALKPQDVITCQYREHGVFLQRGFTLKDFMSQLAANCNDPGKGRNMPVHYTGKAKVNIHAVASTLGTQIPHAVGAGYALKLRSASGDAAGEPSEPGVGVAYFGEGAASEGDFHGALNMAAVMRSPVVFACRNNGFAISTPAAEQYKGDGIASRGAGYGIPALRVDGTDIFAVYEATKEARRRALADGGQPVLLELMSYRIHHHSTSDDSSNYRPADEVAYWSSEARHPIARLRAWLTREGLWSDDADKAARSQIRRSVIQELTLAEREKKPALKEIFTDVYAELTGEAEAQREELRKLMLKYPAEYDIQSHVGGIEGL